MSLTFPSPAQACGFALLDFSAWRSTCMLWFFLTSYVLLLCNTYGPTLVHAMDFHRNLRTIRWMSPAPQDTSPHLNFMSWSLHTAGNQRSLPPSAGCRSDWSLTFQAKLQAFTETGLPLTPNKKSWRCKLRIKRGAAQSSNTSILQSCSKDQPGAVKLLLSCCLISVSLFPPCSILGCSYSLFVLSQIMARVGIIKYRAA